MKFVGRQLQQWNFLRNYTEGLNKVQQDRMSSTGTHIYTLSELLYFDERMQVSEITKIDTITVG